MADDFLSMAHMQAGLEEAIRERDQIHAELETLLERLTSERDRLRALLRECLPLVEWHESTGYLGYTVAPRPDLSLRLKAALEG